MLIEKNLVADFKSPERFVFGPQLIVLAVTIERFWIRQI
tara:strand:+ start:425 stop:541 length:117 start_codon:yes stop_codon:yes gene_type:complete